jgi:hypothetical protein
MNRWKKSAKYLARKLKAIKNWQLILALIIFGVFSLVCLRANNTNMMELRNQLLVADKTADIQKIEQSAEQLRQYSQHHMNADTGQIALQNLYNQKVQQAFSVANAEIDASGYTTATENCKVALSQTGYQGYADCVASAVGLSEIAFKTPELPNPAMYYLNYSSPIISFDLAGVFCCLTFVVFLAIFLRLLTGVILGLVLRFRDKK